MGDAERWDHYLRGWGPGDYTAWRRAWAYFASRRVRFGMNTRPSTDRVYARYPAPRVVAALHRR